MITAPTMSLTDAGLETELIFLDGRDLPAFAAFPLLDDDDGRARLRTYFADFTALARDLGFGLVLETPTWRANPAWMLETGYDPADVARVNRDAVLFMREITAGTDTVVSGCVGPRGDGYAPTESLDAAGYAAHHLSQVAALAEAGADRVTAFTLSTVAEGVGFATAAARIGVPSIVGFTVEVDGRLPDGTSLGAAIRRTDEATGSAPAWYLVNCAHPTHIASGLEDADWRMRVGSVRVNASTLSHAELDTSTELDDGDPELLAKEVGALLESLPAVQVVGGCCGTDIRHITALAEALPR